jgi:hypothetical protein
MKTGKIALMFASLMFTAPLSAPFAKEVIRQVDVSPRDAGGSASAPARRDVRDSNLDTTNTGQSAATRDPMTGRTIDDEPVVTDTPSDVAAIGVGAIALAFLIIVGFVIYSYRHRDQTV